MGSGASIEAELSKPIDGSDLDGGDPAAAKAEVLRLRALLAQAGRTDPAPARTPAWTLGYGAYKNISFEKETAAGAARDSLILRAFDDLIEGRKTCSGRVAVLGVNTPTSEGYPPQKVNPCEIRVLEHYSQNGKPATADAGDPGETTAPLPTTIAEGPMWYIQKPGAGSSECYVIVGTQSAKSKESVGALIEAHQKVAVEQLGFEEGALGYAILPPVDNELILRNMAWFASADAHSAHQARRDPARMAVMKPLMDLIDFSATDVPEAGIREFASAAHLESEGLRKAKGKGINAIVGFGEEE